MENVLSENHLFSDRDGNEPCAGAMQCARHAEVMPPQAASLIYDKRRQWRVLAARKWLGKEMDGWWTLHGRMNDGRVRFTVEGSLR